MGPLNLISQADNMSSSLRVSVILCLVAVSYAFVLGGPAHASCHATWTLNLDCASVRTKILSQIKTWTDASGCASGGEKCLYALKSSDASSISLTHTTPVKHYVDDVAFDLDSKSATSCSVKGYSRSETWYAYLDFGTNYCNMKNLLSGSGLDKTDGFSETTDDSICTQHSSA